MIIIGAGLAGCLAGALERKAIIYEAGSEPSGEHKAVLRFREDKISRALGIPFQKVTVRKSIYANGRHYLFPTIEFQNAYSSKVIGRITERSIADLSTVQRFIAPSNLHAMLAEMCGRRINYNSRITKIGLDDFWVETSKVNRLGEPIISTMPLRIMLNIAFDGIERNHEFRFSPIQVERWRVPDCDVHQTVYFPFNDTPAYRATLTGEDLIVETIGNALLETSMVLDAFGLRSKDVQFIESQSQKYGKIQPIDSAQRKAWLLRLTQERKVYSLGRFACWRNILLDDVYDDLFKVRSMINLSHYDLIRSTL